MKETADTGSPRRTSASLRKRRVIIDTALDEFSRFGLHGARVDTIAARAGVSKTNLLYYFNNKEALYLAVLHSTLEQWMAPLRDFSREQAPLDAIRRYLRAKLEAARDHPAASRLFCAEMMQGAERLRPLLEGELKALVDEKSEVIQYWVDSGQLAPITPHHLLYLLWATTQHYADFAPQVAILSGQGLDDRGFFNDVLATLEDVIFRGIQPLHP